MILDYIQTNTKTVEFIRKTQEAKMILSTILLAMSLYNRRSNHLWHPNHSFKQKDIRVKHNVPGNEFTGKRHQPRREHRALLTWYCDSPFHYNLNGKPEHSLCLPPANLSISMRSHGSLWISCITSPAAAEATNNTEAPSGKLNEEVSASLQEVWFLQWPSGLVQTLCQNCTN